MKLVKIETMKIRCDNKRVHNENDNHDDFINEFTFYPIIAILKLKSYILPLLLTHTHLSH